MKFRINDKVKIVACYNGHEFDIGEIVTVVKYIDGSYIAENEYDYWWVADDELELVEEK